MTSTPPPPKPLEPVAAALAEGAPRRAVKRFRGLCEQGQVPCGSDDLPWLLKHLGKAETGKLIDAFATTRCFYCRGGLERCGDCDGRGYLEDAAACETCIGLGLARCDYCDGSGWVGISFVPDCLQMGVIIDRARHALRDIERITDELSQLPLDPNGPNALKHDAAILLRLNGLLGVLENDVLDAGQLNTHAHQSREHIEKLTQQWVITAVRTQHRMYDLLRRMELDAQATAEQAGDRPGARAIARGRAELYRRLRRTNGFEQTGLDHPYLRAAAAKLPPEIKDALNEI